MKVYEGNCISTTAVHKKSQKIYQKNNNYKNYTYILSGVNK